MAAILLILALIIAGFGMMSLTQATMGVGILAIACLFAIFARIAQASAHQKELKRLLIEINSNK
jgi:hypothetical protein